MDSHPSTAEPSPALSVFSSDVQPQSGTDPSRPSIPSSDSRSERPTQRQPGDVPPPTPPLPPTTPPLPQPKKRDLIEEYIQKCSQPQPEEALSRHSGHGGSASAPQAADASQPSAIPPWSDQLLTDLVSLQFQYNVTGSSGLCDDLQSSSEKAVDRLERMLNQQHVAAHHQVLKLALAMKRALENGEHEAYEVYGKVVARLMAENRKTSLALLDRADRAKRAKRAEKLKRAMGFRP